MNDSQQNDDNEAMDVAPMPIANATGQLGVTLDALRAFLQRGKPAGRNVEKGWRVRLQKSTAGYPTGDASERQDTPADLGRPRQTGETIDLSPIAEVLERLSHRNADLSATASMWQTRALYLQQELDHPKQLTTTVDPQHDEGEHADGPPGALHRPGTAPADETDDELILLQFDEPGLLESIRQRWWRQHGE